MTQIWLPRLHNLIQNDMTVSQQKKDELCSKCENAEFITRLVCFGMERTFVKRDAKTQAMLKAGLLSPVVSDYVYDGFVPKPCKHFVGRDDEIEEIHNLLQKHDKLFINGVAGIGKSETAKKYAEKYKNEYTNILYFNYSGDLREMIADCDFSDDNTSDDEAVRFKRHNQFLRSLKQDTLIIIDNFNVYASDDKLFDVVMKYRCRVLFTTRSRFENYHCYELKEINTETLLQLVEYFYTGNTETVIQIIDEVYCHTMSVELAARLLASGMSEPEELLQKLRDAKAVLNTDDEIGIIKDGASKKATYYQHIHTLVSLSILSTEAQDIMRNMCLMPPEGIDLPYYKLIFSIAENIINISERDNMEKYKTFLKDIFGYMEKYKYKNGMELILSELKELSENNEDYAILYDYKAAYEHICNGNDKAALKYSVKAAKLCRELEQSNPALTSNVYGNLSSLYHADGQLENAKKYAEKAYNILKACDLEYLNDSLIQLMNIANLAVSMGRPMKAIEILKNCAKRVGVHGSDYGDIHSYIGQLYFSVGDTEQASKHFRIAIDTYSDVWQNDPERLQEKISELRQLINACRSHGGTPFFDKILVSDSLKG